MESAIQFEPSLYNKDLAPVPPEKRTWGIYNYASLWVAMSVCIPTYMLASGLIAGGMSWKQAIATILLGNVIVLIPMLLNAHAGAKYGIPFPVFARASFGVRGANVPAVLRAIVACGWFGIQAWIGGQAIYSMLQILYPSATNKLWEDWLFCRYVGFTITPGSSDSQWQELFIMPACGAYNRTRQVPRGLLPHSFVP
jgi:nucleobase:cation symporter-1, NCS1 family